MPGGSSEEEDLKDKPADLDYETLKLITVGETTRFDDNYLISGSSEQAL